jgi:hypothetical protein
MKVRLPLIFSTLALVISLTGAGAYAASQVSGTTIMNHTIGIGKLTPLAVKQLKGHNGQNGTDGLDGSDGYNGANGVNGGFDPAKISYVQGPATTLIGGTAYNTLSVACPAGTKVISGSWSSDLGDDYYGKPSIDGASYSVLIATYGYAGFTGTGNAYAVCAAP